MTTGDMKSPMVILGELALIQHRIAETIHAITQANDEGHRGWDLKVMLRDLRTKREILEDSLVYRDDE